MQRVVILYFFIICQFSYAEKIYYNKNKEDVYLKKYTNTKISKSLNVDYYINEKDIVVGITDKLIVKFSNTINLQKYLEVFRLKVEKKLSNKMYLLITENKNKTVEISRELNKKEDVQYAHPDFIKKIKKR